MSCRNFQKQSCQLCENKIMDFCHTADLWNINAMNKRVSMALSYSASLMGNNFDHCNASNLLIYYKTQNGWIILYHGHTSSCHCHWDFSSSLLASTLPINSNITIYGNNSISTILYTTATVRSNSQNFCPNSDSRVMLVQKFIWKTILTNSMAQGNKDIVLIF